MGSSPSSCSSGSRSAKTAGMSITARLCSGGPRWHLGRGRRGLTRGTCARCSNWEFLARSTRLGGPPRRRLASTERDLGAPPV
eukprot:scaffold9315_cov57-Phaeocystis_antarctica.AAC.2